jgi:hypothetical protein
MTLEEKLKKILKTIPIQKNVAVWSLCQTAHLKVFPIQPILTLTQIS